MLIAAIFLILTTHMAMSQPPAGIAIAGGQAPPPPPPPGRGFQVRCSDAFAQADQSDPALLLDFINNAPPGYEAVQVEPTIHPGKNAHRYLVKYRSQNFRRCEDIRRVFQNMSTYKPQKCNVGTIAVVPGGYLVEYRQFCQCYRRSYRRRRLSYYATQPRIEPSGTVRRCDDRDLTCGFQPF